MHGAKKRKNRNSHIRRNGIMAFQRLASLFIVRFIPKI
jgi:hypothetical protein